MHQLVQKVSAIALEAGKAIMAVYGDDIAVTRKEDNSPLTQADMAAHHTIMAGLAALAPALPVISEESTSIPYQERKSWRRYWLVDPLDGTREFIKRNGEFTVNIALIDGDRPVLGVVYAPAMDLLFYAAQGQGAFRQLAGRPAEKIRARQFDPTQITVAGSRSHGDDRLHAFLDRIGPHMLISMGSSLKICLIAEGRADVYPRLGPTSEWDTAAAQCVLEEAGGTFTDWQGKPTIYSGQGVATNGHLLAEVIAITKGNGELS